MRYERKYRIETSSFDSVLHEVMSNALGFKQAFPDRLVNSIYYDDINYTSYNDNLLGIGNRVKYRVRWYGESLRDIKKPILEKKIKKSLLGLKEYQNLTDFSLTEGAPKINEFLNTNQLFPYIIVRYHRLYLVSADEKVRATIDKDLQYINLMNRKVSQVSNKDRSLILEIKYDEGDEVLANDCMQMIPYRLTKNSKYVSAMNYYLH